MKGDLRRPGCFGSQQLDQSPARRTAACEERGRGSEPREDQFHRKNQPRIADSSERDHRIAQILLQNKQGNLLAQDLDFLQRILANATDQLHLINTLLDLSKMEVGTWI